MGDAEQLATAQLSRAADSAGPSRQLAPGDQLGRYVVLEYVGAGANGEVCAAYDPELDRRVAIKLMRKHSRRANRALTREAQAMAKLSHGNLVAVHDVGKLLRADGGAQLFIAMEYVPGQTLREWWAETPRSVEQIVSHFAQAGRGLAAAHRHGVIHRDFKPDNVLVGRDGRVRVTDFGLALSAREQRVTADESAPEGERSTSRALDEDARPVQPSSRWQGTPAYMSPEQFTGEPVGPLSDQFSFCVSFYEALFGRRPFEGASSMDIARLVCEGQPTPPPRTAEVPRRIVDTVMRGLSRAPADRFENMYALLAALDPPARRPWMWVALALGAGLATLGWSLSREPPVAPDPCLDASAQLGLLWTPARRSALEGAVLDTQAPSAPEVSELLLDALDDYADSWAIARRDSCRARLDARQGDLAYLDRRDTCLDARLRSLAARVEALESIEPSQVDQLVSVAEALPRVDSCSELELLASLSAPPPALAQDVHAFERRLERAEALLDSGARARAQSELDPVITPIATLDYEPLRCRLQLLRGELASAQHDSERGLELLREAYFCVLALGDAQRATSAATLLVRLYAIDLNEPERGLEWLEHARANSQQAGLDSSRRIAADAEAIHHVRSGELELALDAALRALDHARAEGRPIPIGQSAGNLAAILISLHRWQESLPHHLEAIELLSREYGGLHPDAISARLNYALSLSNLEQEQQARAQLELAWEQLERRAEPSDELNRALIHNALGELDARAGDWHAAAEHFGAMYEIMRAQLGDDTSYTNVARSSYAGALHRIGRSEEGLALAEAAVAWADANQSPAEERAQAYFELGVIVWEHSGQRERASELCRASKALYESEGIELQPIMRAWIQANSQTLEI